MSRDHSPTKSSDDWIDICQRELSNISGSYLGKLSNDAKVDHALLAIESVLKAIIWKREKWAEWPKPRKGIKYLYNHDIDAMLDKTGLRSRLRLDDDLWASWQVLANAVVKQHRYSPAPPPNDEANAIAKSARHPDVGVAPWLIERYHEMN